MDILSKAKDVIIEYDNITQEMINPDNMLNQEKMIQLSKKRSNLKELYTLSKGFIVLNWFMHLKHDTATNKFIILSTIFFLALMAGICYSDLFFRS